MVAPHKCARATCLFIHGQPYGRQAGKQDTGADWMAGWQAGLVSIVIGVVWLSVGFAGISTSIKSQYYFGFCVMLT